MLNISIDRQFTDEQKNEISELYVSDHDHDNVISFNNADKELIKFHLSKDVCGSGGILVELGEGVTIDEASKSFVECFCGLFNERIEEIRREAFEGGVAEGRRLMSGVDVVGEYFLSRPVRELDLPGESKNEGC